MTPTMEARRLKMEPWTVCRQVVADLHHFDDKQDPVRIRIKVKRSVRMRIRMWAKRDPGSAKLSVGTTLSWTSDQCFSSG
jgi:hypothetical protein